MNIYQYFKKILKLDSYLLNNNLVEENRNN